MSSIAIGCVSGLLVGIVGHMGLGIDICIRGRLRDAGGGRCGCGGRGKCCGMVGIHACLVAAIVGVLVITSVWLRRNTDLRP